MFEDAANEEIEWANLSEAAQIILNCSRIQFSDLELEKVRDFVSIKNHINTLVYSLGV